MLILDFGRVIGNTTANLFRIWPEDYIPDNNGRVETVGRGSAYWYMGKTYDLEKPKFLVQLRSTQFMNTKEHLKPNRYFILDGDSHNPVNYRKFYYFDAPNMLEKYPTSIYYSDSPDYSALFKSASNWTNVHNQYINEYVFKYVNLDDASDTKADITLTPIGLTRRNPWKELYRTD